MSDSFWVFIGSALTLALSLATLYAIYRYFRDNLRLK
jgi:hypothetical protein